MKYLDRGIIYLQVKHDAAEEEVSKIKEQYSNQNKTIVILREGLTSQKTILKNLITASLK
jgi:hypothetical protein